MIPLSKSEQPVFKERSRFVFPFSTSFFKALSFEAMLFMQLKSHPLLEEDAVDESLFL